MSDLGTLAEIFIVKLGGKKYYLHQKEKQLVSLNDKEDSEVLSDEVMHFLFRRADPVFAYSDNPEDKKKYPFKVAHRRKLK